MKTNNLTLYHGTNKRNLKSIMKFGLLRARNNGGWFGEGGDSTYIYATKDIEIARKYGNLILEINGKGLDLRVWSKSVIDSSQIMIKGNIPPSKIKFIKSDKN